jgi:hypothetical protein
MKHVFPDIPGLVERLEPGCVVPAGECPACGALAYSTKECLNADKVAKDIRGHQEPGSDLIDKLTEALGAAEGVIRWALDHGASQDGTGAIHKMVRVALRSARKHSCGGNKKDTGVYRYFDVSTGHIQEKDMRLLDYDGRPRLEHGIIAVSHDFGAWVHLMDDAHDLDYLNVRAGGFSDQFVKMLEEARKRGCEWINIDQDGFVHAELERCEW